MSCPLSRVPSVLRTSVRLVGQSGTDSLLRIEDPSQRLDEFAYSALNPVH